MAKAAKKPVRAAKPAPKMTPKPPQRRKLLTVKQRDRLLGAAMKTLAEQGYDAFTVARVASRAKLDLATVRSSFPSKLHLLAAALETNVEKDSDDTEALILREIDFKGDLDAAMVRMMSGQLHRHINGGWLTLFTNLDLSMEEPDHADMWRMMEHRIGERGIRIVGEMQRRGYIDDGLEPMWVQFFWNALMDGIGVRLRALPEGTGVAEISKALAPILLRGFAPKRP
ncbi:MAG: TetR/AcrR family transcriptional regulator [Micropepsaceae bacterium]